MKTDKTDYLIIELNAKKIVENWPLDKTSGQGIFHFDFTLYENRKIYINTIDRYDSCPLFDQISFLYQDDNFKDKPSTRFLTKIPRKDGISYIDLADSRKIDKALIFVDCTGVIKQGMLEKTDNEDAKLTADEKIFLEKSRSIFINGITINYGEETIHYIPFDKSNSMSKRNKISFIDERLYEPLNKRLLFDIDFKATKYQLVLSKFFAYKGLYMSSSVRMDTEYLLNDAKLFQQKKKIDEPLYKTLARKIIVISEQNWNVSCKGQEFYSNPPTTSYFHPYDKKDEKYEYYIRDTRDNYFLENLFDGEGIISPDYAKLINLSINKDNSDATDATSFQIRMPFVKGMLHQVDFKNFLNSYVQNTKETKPIYIKDYFNNDRDLREAEIIMPSSMFKWAKWLDDINKEHKELLGNHDDIMHFYFEKFIEYNHSLYIANTNAILGNKKYTTLNYQFLNTLKFTPENLTSLLDSHIEKAMDPYSYLKEMSIVDMDDDGAPVFNEMSSSMAALMKNRIFEHQKKVDADLRATSNSLVTDLALGKIIVDGELRFLSRDLLFLLTNLLYRIADYIKIELEKDTSLSDDTIVKYQDQISSLKSVAKKIHYEKALPQWTFYMADSKIDLNKNNYYSIFRNPHLSRNEQCALKPFTNKLYEKYFSHLSGVIMLSVDSLDPLALGGADFDGDFVKIVANEKVTQAVLDGAYKKILDGDKFYYVRKLPIINIVSISAPKFPVPDTTDEKFLSIVSNTFDSKVGHISNAAIKLGQVQYAYNSESKKTKMPMKCQDCTIITGLEIDAAKTGYHPNVEINCNELELPFEYIEDFKKKLDKLNSDSSFHFTKISDEIIDNRSVIIKHNNTELSYTNGNIINNLSYLPLYFFRNIGRYKAPKSDDTSGYIYFPFMCKEVTDNSGNMVKKYDRTWKKNIDTELHKNVASIVCAYQKMQELISQVNRYIDYSGRNNTMAFIRFILTLQNDDINSVKVIAEDVLPKAYMAIEKRARYMTSDNSNIYSTLDTMISIIKDEQWAFILDSQKFSLIRKLFDINPDSLSVEDIEFCHEIGIPVSDNDESIVTEYNFVSIVSNFLYQGYNLLYYIFLDIKSSIAEFENSPNLISYKSDSLMEKLKDVSEDNDLIESLYFKDYYNHLYDIYSNLDFLTISELRKMILKDCKTRIKQCFKDYYKRTNITPQMYEKTEDQIKVLYGLDRFSYKEKKSKFKESIVKVDANSRFFWDYFNADEILPFIEESTKGDVANV